MFEGISTAVAAWREILHISEWTGLSLGALAGLGALFYFVPLARKLAVAAAITVVVGWGGLIHGEATGRADLQKQWDQAKATAEKAQAERDAGVDEQLKSKYGPQLLALQKQASDNKERADAYESKMVGLLAKSPAGPGCQLGAAADRVRGRR